MTSVVPNPRAIRAFATEAAFEAWLRKNHDRKAEIWIKVFKKASGKATIDTSQALDIALCWGWIDGLRKPFDDEAFLQRYSPRKAKSRWSQLNVQRVQRLIKASRMTPAGQRHIDAAKADGRWSAAYPSPSAIEPPSDLVAAISKNRRASEAFRALTKQQLGFLAYRVHHVKTPARRSQLIAELVSALSSGSVPVPARLARAPARTRAPKRSR